MTARLDYELRPMPPPFHTVVYGLHWLVTVGDEPDGPRILAVVSDPAVGERICELLAERDSAEVDALIASAGGGA